MRIITNGNIYSLDGSQRKISSLAIDNGRILAVGDESTIRTAFPNSSDLHDLDGATVIPGLIDSHIHLQNFALGLKKINCENLTKAECLQKVADQVKRSTPGKWILGHGWNQNDWEDGYGTAMDLERAAPDNPVLLTAKSLHAAWVNFQALNLANVNDETDSPTGGDIQRDSSSQPTGILFENAIELVSSKIPKPSQKQVISSILTAQDELLQMGITGIHDFDGKDCFSALQAIQRDGNLKLRVTKNIPFENFMDAINLGLRSGFGNDWLRIGGVKVFMDGALGPHTAAMIEPYHDDPNNRGMLFMDADDLFQFGKCAVKNGFSLAIHAIGDRANHEVLNALEKIIKFEKTHSIHPKLRHRIEHVQVLDPLDIARLAQCGIIASMQPIHAISDMIMADRYWGERAAYSYGWKSQLDHGAVLCFGSDAPVETPQPFCGIHAAVTRQRDDGYPGHLGWYPEQCLTAEEAVRAYTVGPAYATGSEDHMGKLIPGYFADLIVLDRDIFQCHPDDIKKTSVKASMITGEWVYWDL